MAKSRTAAPSARTAATAPAAAESGGILLLCIAVSDALYDKLGIGQFQWLNNPKRPLSRLRQPDWRSELVDIGRQIEQLIVRQRGGAGTTRPGELPV